MLPARIPYRRPQLAQSVVLVLCCGLMVTGCDRGQQDAPAVPAPTADHPLVRAASDEAKLKQAFELQRQGNSLEAFKLVQQVLITTPESPTALRLAAEIQKHRGMVGEAAELACRAAAAEPTLATSMLVFAFDCHLRDHQFEAAEEDLKRAAEIDPTLPQVQRLLAQLLNAQGRRLEASRHVRELIRMRDVKRNELLSLIDLRGPFLLASFGEFAEAVPDSLFAMGEIRLRHSGGREDPQLRLEQMERIVEKHPNQPAAAAFYLRMLADTDRFEELAKAIARLPTGIEEHAEYWFSLGALLAHQNRDREAIRAFAEAIRRDPTDRESRRGTISSLLAIGEHEKALALRERLADLDRLFRIARDADADQTQWISETLEKEVRPWEATAWLMQSALMRGDLSAVIPELDRRHAAISQWESKATDEQVAAARLERLLGFQAEQWQLPELASLGTASGPRIASGESADQNSKSNINLVDVAERAGIAVEFVSGFPADAANYSTYQVNGGGIAALDYDLDGRCDVYLVQAGGDPQTPDSSQPNQLFRLLPEERFLEVTTPSLTGDRHFGQGVCAGDVNQDGFPDLLVANIGINTLYINQGDGSFRPATERIEDNSFQWTSSVAVGDLDGDHLPEIIEINYIDDPDAYQVKCTDNYLDCQPQRFRKSHDRVLRCDANGTFSTWSDFSKNGPPARLGFGVVIANFDRKHGNDFFISNDGDFNHYWVSDRVASAEPAPYRLVESANLYGCNVGRGGDSQACMGVASGDFNRDGTLDLHVTNFHNEPVNLFLMSDSGIFTDQASLFGLSEPSFGVLGFGTQAADFDNDGWLDLAVLNGHVYDGRKAGVPFQMPPQAFQGSRDGFRLLDPASTGPYWQTPQLGRTLATLDWNRDGKVDLFANHLDLPVALLENHSAAENWVQFELVGTTSERDAIGAEVRIEIGEENWTGWQTGGDGLMSSNEAMIHFGIGAATLVERVDVRWPSGRTQQVANLAVNRRYLIVEGSNQPAAR